MTRWDETGSYEIESDWCYCGERKRCVRLPVETGGSTHHSYLEFALMCVATIIYALFLGIGYLFFGLLILGVILASWM